MSATLSNTIGQRSVSQPISVGKLSATVLFFLTAGIACFNLSTLNPDKLEVGLDMQVLVKLALTGMAGAIGFYGWVTIPKVREILLSFPGLWLTIIAVCYVLASITSITPLNSIASSGALICVILFGVTAIVMTSPMFFLRGVMLGFAWFIALSWFAYLFVPSIGVFVEPLLHGLEVIRMGGLSHPNTLGQYCAIYMGLVIILKSQKRLDGSIWWFVFVLAAMALYFSMSRASTIALIASLAYAGRYELWKRLGPIGTVSLMIVGLAAIALVTWKYDLTGAGGEQVLSSIAKSGDAEEVSSLTGRTKIWGFAIDRIKERPWLGFGPATSKEIMSEYMSYTHNLWLNLAFSAGIFCGIAGLMLTIGRIAESVVRPHLIIDFLLLFLCINGLVENVMFAYVPSAPTMLLVLVVTWHVLRTKTQSTGEGA